MCPIHAIDLILFILVLLNKDTISMWVNPAIINHPANRTKLIFIVHDK